MNKFFNGLLLLIKLIVVVLALCSQVFADDVYPSKTLPIIDIHAHFFPNITVKTVIRAMDEENVIFAVFMPVPNAGRNHGGKHRGKREASDEFYQDAASQIPQRVAAFYGGNRINQLLIVTDANTISESDRIQFRKDIEEILGRGVYKGIGELGPRHIAYLPGMNEIEYPADHPLMLTLSDLAAKYEIPMDIHLEATEKTILQLERLLLHNRMAKIIWDHAGWSNTGLATPELMRKLMIGYPNLYSSIKYRKAQTMAQEKVKLIDDTGELITDWKALFEEFSERFFIGTDVKLGDTDMDYKHAERHRKILSQLSEATASKIAWENAINLLHLQKWSGTILRMPATDR